jgi:hypothetical protein
MRSRSATQAALQTVPRYLPWGRSLVKLVDSRPAINGVTKA